MKKNAKQNKRFIKAAAVFFAVLFFVFGLHAASSSVSESLMDDVTAMITNAKKLPHTVFILDTSESMNTFAYSDYIDTCADGKSNVEKAIILCDNAYKQCRNVEANASCAVDLGCAYVQARCYQMRQKQADLVRFCNKLDKMFEEPDRRDNTHNYENAKYIGPWNPQETYDADLCFYDWTQDGDGDVLEGTTSGHESNPSGGVSATYNEQNYYNTDRRDWDCITDGKDRMYDGKDSRGYDKFYSTPYSQFTKDYECDDEGKNCTGGLSGYWLNWKYATSLDAVKIILANVHSFSYPPRSRGANECYGSSFFPRSADGTTSVCYLDFNTNVKTCEETDETCKSERLAELEAIREAVLSKWDSEYKLKDDCTDQSDPSCYKKFENTVCQNFSLENGFSIFPEGTTGHHKQPDDQNPCGKCMYWNNAEGIKDFEEVECSYFDGTKINEVSHDISLTATFGEKTCCKTFQCTNPKCRDDDIHCKDDTSYNCSLGYYSEYDQDKNHCCGTISCVENGEVQTSSTDCDGCKTGSPQGDDTVSAGGEEIQIIAPTSGVSGCSGKSYEDNIPFSIKIKTLSGISAATNPQNMESLKISSFYRCNGCVGDDCRKPLGTYSCTPDTCAAGATVVSSSLSGCGNEGYALQVYLEATRTTCKFDSINVAVGLEYTVGEYKCGENKKYDILDPTKPYYEVYRMETSASAQNPIVNEYECKTAFYHRQSITVDGTSCPDASLAPAMINEQNGSGKVEYCDPDTQEKETVAVDQWGFTTKVACSWQCRDAIVYEEPWKCASFFYMMNETKYNGLDSAEVESHCRKAQDNPAQPCSGTCKYTSPESGPVWTELEQCCVEIAKQKNLFTHLENPDGITLAQGTSHPLATECWVSGYEFGTASNGRTTTTSGYMAELVTGHIKEAGSGSYKLTPYITDGALYSPYDGWYEQNCFYVKGKSLVNNTFISAFKTTSVADRKPACIYDLMYAWEGEDCNSCGTGCCAIDLGQQDDGCDYPQFWMKVPMSDGGQYIYGAKDFSADDDRDEFRAEIKKLKAVGGATLGETLYDAWRYLGGMYALYDPNHTVGGGNKPYESPFENQDAACFTNEAVVISGGQPQFDHNDAISDNEKIAGTSVSCKNGNAPCVAKVGENLTSETPYYEKEWYQTSILKVANFAKNNSFWGTSSCRTSDTLCKNIVGFEGVAGGCNDDSCKDPDLDYSVNNANKPVINHVHSVAIGEWALSEYYSIFNTSNNDFLNKSLLQNVAEQTGGYYYGLTTEAPSSSGTGEGGTFNTLTDLFGDLMTKPQPTDVVSGRPHWTSSLVQPFDVEEKYRGPETYSAGAVPIDGSVSRFWFGNLKKYMLDDDSQGCSITNDDSSGAACGAWTKQKFESPKDCFGKDDDGTGFSVANSISSDSLAQFKTLMMGGAAYKLAKKLGNEGSGSWPYFQNSPRNIYYDANGNTAKLTVKVSSGSALYDAFVAANPAQTFTTEETEGDAEGSKNINKILDYMAGYDAFKDTVEARKKVRYSPGTGEESFTVDDPINIDFNQSTKITIRPLLLGAIIHSKPIAVYYENSSKTRIYDGANDGMLHAFDASGEEIYAYIPSQALKSIINFGTEQNGIFFNATVDGPITFFHIDQSHDGIINEGEKAYLIFGYRRGAKGYTVIDVSDPDEPKFIQNINVGGGYSFGKAALFRKCEGTCSYAEDLDYYLAVPGGYDTCHDPAPGKLTADAQKLSCLSSQLNGNYFSIFKFDGSKFVELFKYSKESGLWDKDADKSWLVTSFASVPFVVNTSGKAAVNTEYVYFTDLSGTVFRVDVSSSDSSSWKAKVVFAQRESFTPNWSEFSRSYVATNFFPPLERYNPGNNTDLIPITLVTGDAANPKYVEQSKFLVFYDKKTLADSDTIPYAASDFLQNTDGSSGNSNQFISGKRGWNVSFAYPPNISYDEMTAAQKDEYSKAGEKGITEPMITYDIYGGKSGTAKNSYTVAWNTYIPKRATQCKNFGTSSNYERMLLDGSQGLIMPTGLSGANGSRGEWDPAKCSFQNSDISIATGVGIVASKDGYDLTFGAGADIFRKPELTVKTNSTHIIKWYELY